LIGNTSYTYQRKRELNMEIFIDPINESIIDSLNGSWTIKDLPFYEYHNCSCNYFMWLSV